MTNEAVFILSAVAAVSVTLLLLLAGIVTVAPALGVANGETDEKGDESSLRLLISAIGWGFGVIPLLTFWLHLFTRARFSIWLMAAATLMNLIAVAAWRLYRDRRLPRLQAFIPISIVPRAIKSNRLLFIAAALVAFYYFLNFESRLPIDSSCIYAAALEATGFIDGGHDLLKDNIDDTRLGNTALLAAALALYGTFGFRLVYGVCGFLLFLGGFLIGRDAGGSRPWGWMGAIFLSLNPYVLTIPLPDENLFALTAGAAMLHLLFFPRRNWILIGALFALVVTIRHVLVLALPALLYSVFHDENRKIAFAHFMAAFTVLTLPEHMHHHYALGSVFRFESHAQFPPFQYDIFGFGFQWNGMLNWPFHDSIVRTPHNPYPTFLLWILAVARHFGLLLFAVLIIGFVSGCRRPSFRTFFWALWALPAIGSLMVQEAWDQINKMGVIVIVFAAFVPWMIDGFRFVFRRRLAGGILTAALVAGCHMSLNVLESWRARPDIRYYCQKGAGVERNLLIERDADYATDAGLLPRVPVVQHMSSHFLSGSLRSLLPAILSAASPDIAQPLGFFPHEVPPPGNPVTLEIDLNRNPFEEPFISLTPLPADADLTEPGRTVILSGIRAAWSAEPVKLYARGEKAAAVILDFEWAERPDCPETRFDFRFDPWDRTCELLRWLAGVPGDGCPKHHIETITHTSPVIRIRIPSGALNTALVVNWTGEYYLLWKGFAGKDGLNILSSGERFWHN